MSHGFVNLPSNTMRGGRPVIQEAPNLWQRIRVNSQHLCHSVEVVGSHATPAKVCNIVIPSFLLCRYHTNIQYNLFLWHGWIWGELKTWNLQNLLYTDRRSIRGIFTRESDIHWYHWRNKAHVLKPSKFHCLLGRGILWDVSRGRHWVGYGFISLRPCLPLVTINCIPFAE